MRAFYLAEYEEARVRFPQSPSARKQATTKYGGVASSTLASATQTMKKMAYLGIRIICPVCNTPSDDEDYCTTCGVVFNQFDDEQLKREGSQAKGVIDAVDVVKYECPYCGRPAEFGRVYIPRDLTIYFENTFCPECGVQLIPIYQRVEDY